MAIVRIDSNKLPVHGSPQDRGSADRYYHRPFDPHWWPQGTGKGTRCLLYTSPSPRDQRGSRMPSSA